MKGQYLIINEIFIFAIGLTIASFTIMSFGYIKGATESISVNDSMRIIANTVSNGVLKSYYNDNSIMIIKIPADIAGKIYVVGLKQEGGETIISVQDYKNHMNSVEQKLFNIDKNKYFITGSVISSAEYIEIVSDGKNIVLRRAIS